MRNLSKIGEEGGRMEKLLPVLSLDGFLVYLLSLYACYCTIYYTFDAFHLVETGERESNFRLIAKSEIRVASTAIPSLARCLARTKPQCFELHKCRPIEEVSSDEIDSANPRELRVAKSRFFVLCNTPSLNHVAFGSTSDSAQYYNHLLARSNSRPFIRCSLPR